MSDPLPQRSPRRPIRSKPVGWVLVTAALAVLFGVQVLPRILQTTSKEEFIHTVTDGWRGTLALIRSAPAWLVSAALLLLAMLCWLNFRFGRGSHRLRDTLAGLAMLVAFFFSIPGLIWLWQGVRHGDWENPYPIFWRMIVDQTGGDPLPVIFYVLVIAIVGAFALLFRNVGGIGRQLLAKDAAALLESDPRPPILYFRSFFDDPAGFDNADPGFEASLQVVLGKVRPVVAIGRPGEWLQTPGLPRMYVGANWLKVVARLMKKADLLVFRPRLSKGLWLEVRLAVKLVDPRKVAFVLADGESPGEGWATDEAAFRERASGALPQSLPERIGNSQLLTFGPGWEPRLTRAEIRGGLPEAFFKHLHRTRLLHALLVPVLARLDMPAPRLLWLYKHAEKFLLVLAFFLASAFLVAFAWIDRDLRYVVYEVVLTFITVLLLLRRSPHAVLSQGMPAVGEQRAIGS
jgi:hypothetical protein